jgi:serine phosphatase RsbU (regulator of sigma subunit)
VLVRGGAARPLDPPRGILLGAAREAYQVTRLALCPGDLLLLYSDGLIERRDHVLDEGLVTLCAAVRGVSDPEQAIAAALRALKTADSEDDTCVVAMRVL